MSWPEGPRDWSPRLAQALREVEKLRPLIPAELIVEKLGYWNTGTVIPCNYNGVSLLSKITIIVKIPWGNTKKIDLSPSYKGPFEEKGVVHVYSDGFVHVYSDGFVHVDIEIYYLLTGQINGYEYLAGRWPWADIWGPPDPTEKEAPKKVAGVGPAMNSLAEY